MKFWGVSGNTDQSHAFALCWLQSDIRLTRNPSFDVVDLGNIHKVYRLELLVLSLLDLIAVISGNEIEFQVRLVLDEVQSKPLALINFAGTCHSSLALQGPS